MNKTDTESKLIVIALKLKTGEDVLGYYGSEMKMEGTQEEAIVLIRPMRLQLVNTVGDNGVATSYVPSLYFPYGGVATPFPMSIIAQQTIANTFFSTFYAHIINLLISNQDDHHKFIATNFENLEYSDILSTIEPINIHTELTTVQ